MELAHTLLQKKQEIKEFKVAFGKLIEDQFPVIGDEWIKFIGMNHHNLACQKMKASLRNMVELIRFQYESSKGARSVEDEKAVQYRLILRFVGLGKKSGLFSEGFEANVFIAAEVGLLNANESIRLKCLSLEFEENGEVRQKKSNTFLDALQDLISNKIPAAKSRVYAKALGTANQEQLYRMGESVLNSNPVSSLSREGGVYLCEPGAWLSPPPFAPGYMPANENKVEACENSPEGLPSINLEPAEIVN